MRLKLTMSAHALEANRLAANRAVAPTNEAFIRPLRIAVLL
jgi:hypothetical protein